MPLAGNGNEHIRRARNLVHSLSGLIGAIPYGLSAIDSSSSMQSILECIADVRQVAQEAEQKLSELRTVLREMTKHTP